MVSVRMISASANKAVAANCALITKAKPAFASRKSNIAQNSGCLLLIQDISYRESIIAVADTICSRVFGSPLSAPTYSLGMHSPYGELTEEERLVIYNTLDNLLPARISRAIVPCLASTMILSTSNIQVSDVDIFGTTMQLISV